MLRLSVCLSLYGLVISLACSMVGWLDVCEVVVVGWSDVCEVVVVVVVVVARFDIITGVRVVVG